MEKTFEEKFGLNLEEMEKILGGQIEAPAVCAAGSCAACSASCFFCTTCVGCQTKFADVVPLE